MPRPPHSAHSDWRPVLRFALFGRIWLYAHSLRHLPPPTVRLLGVVPYVRVVFACLALPWWPVGESRRPHGDIRLYAWHSMSPLHWPVTPRATHPDPLATGPAPWPLACTPCQGAQEGKGSRRQRRLATARFFCRLPRPPASARSDQGLDRRVACRPRSFYGGPETWTRSQRR